jgi:hypothetical protein
MATVSGRPERDEIVTEGSGIVEMRRGRTMARICPARRLPGTFELRRRALEPLLHVAVCAQQAEQAHGAQSCRQRGQGFPYRLTETKGYGQIEASDHGNEQGNSEEAELDGGSHGGLQKAADAYERSREFPKQIGDAL